MALRLNEGNVFPTLSDFCSYFHSRNPYSKTAFLRKKYTYTIVSIPLRETTHKMILVSLPSCRSVFSWSQQIWNIRTCCCKRQLDWLSRWKLQTDWSEMHTSPVHPKPIQYIGMTCRLFSKEITKKIVNSAIIFIHSIFFRISTTSCRDISVGRASDWRSEGPWFNSGEFVWVLNNPWSRRILVF